MRQTSSVVKQTRYRLRHKTDVLSRVLRNMTQFFLPLEDSADISCTFRLDGSADISCTICHLAAAHALAAKGLGDDEMQEEHALSTSLEVSQGVRYTSPLYYQSRAAKSLDEQGIEPWTSCIPDVQHLMLNRCATNCATRPM